METSPPVRDIRNRANRNKCIIVVAVSSAVILAAVVILLYITHFSSTELTPESATALIDEAISRNRNDTMGFCRYYEFVLKENDTSLIDRLGDCQETPPERDDLERRNETSDEPRANIICKLSTANIKIQAVNTSRTLRKDCRFNSTIVVDFTFNTDNKVQNITIRSDKITTPNTGRRNYDEKEISLGLLVTLDKILRDNVLQLVGGYATADARVDDVSINWDHVCKTAPDFCD